MKLRAVLFDLDDTLIDLKKSSLIAFNSALERHNLRKISPKEMIQNWHLNWKEIIKMLVPDEENLKSLTESVGKDYLEILSKIHLRHSKIYPKAYETLKELHERGFLIAIVSRRPKKIIEEEIGKFKFKEFVDAVVGYEDVSRQKPAPDPIILAANLLRVSTSDCVVVGDSSTDIKAGRLAGAVTILVLTGPNSLKDISGEKPRAMIKNLADLIPELDKLVFIP